MNEEDKNNNESDNLIENDSQEESISVTEIHPINNAINDFVHGVLDIEHCAKEYIVAASKSYQNNADRLKSEIEDYQEILNKSIVESERLVAVRNLEKIMRDVDRHNNSKPFYTLEKSLFINMFSVLDKFIGDLIICFCIKENLLYTKK